MKVLVICQYYWPEPFITSDICEGLVARGHEITLITGLPNYGMPNGEIPSEYANEAYSETIRNGVRVIRLPLAPRKSGSINRIKNYLTFWRNANDFIQPFDEDHDVVLGLQFSPVMQVDSGIVYAKKHEKKCFCIATIFGLSVC